MKPAVSAIESFESKYTPEPYSGCWLWVGAITTAGYGKIKTGNFRMDAHRAAYVLFKGEIPKGMHVLHKCDVKSCVNPDHLFLGTHTDNMLDCAKKGRSAIHEKHGMAKLTWDKVIEIRQSNESQYKLSRKYGVTQGHISLIKSRKCWNEFIGDME